MMLSDAGTMPAERAMPWPRPARAWWAVVVFFGAAVLSYTDRQILTLLIDPLRAELAISDTDVSLLQGLAFALIYSVAGLPLGRAADLFARRGVIIAGVATWSLATLACAYAHSFEALFLARVFVGVGEACLAPAAMSMIGDYLPPHRRGAAFGLFMLGMIVGGGIAILFGGALLQAIEHGLLAALPLLRDLSAWRAVLALMALPGVALVLCLLTLREPARRSPAGRSHALPLRAVWADLRRHRAVLLPLYLGMALMTFGDAAMGNWLPALLSRKFAMGAAAIGQLYGGAVIVSASIGVFGGGLAADRLIAGGFASTRAQVSMWAAALALPGAFAGLGDSANAVVFGFAWWALMSAAAASVAIAALPELAPAHMRGVAIALASFGNIMLGTGGGTLATPWLNDHAFADPLRIGVSMTLATAPAGLAAAWFFWRSWRASSRGSQAARALQADTEFHSQSQDH
jgi:MFS family permease